VGINKKMIKECLILQSVRQAVQYHKSKTTIGPTIRTYGNIGTNHTGMCHIFCTSFFLGQSRKVVAKIGKTSSLFFPHYFTSVISMTNDSLL
jgi:hypothetical protein